MNKSIGIILFTVGLFAPRLTAAQGSLYVSNLGQTSSGSASIGSDSWLAQMFETGTNPEGYILNSVQLLMDASSGSPSGFAISIYSSVIPAIDLGPNNNLGSLNGLDPSAGGIFTYAASGLMLAPSTWYNVVVTAATPVAQETYNWSLENTPPPIIGLEHWVVPGVTWTSTNGSNWNRKRLDRFQLGIYATAVPEPATVALAGLGLACLSVWKHRHGK